MWHIFCRILILGRYRRAFQTKTKTWKESDEIAYYISTIDLSAQLFCKAIRNHWGIENRNHYMSAMLPWEKTNLAPVSIRIFLRNCGVLPLTFYERTMSKMLAQNFLIIA